MAVPRPLATESPSLSPAARCRCPKRQTRLTGPAGTPSTTNRPRWSASTQVVPSRNRTSIAALRGSPSSTDESAGWTDLGDLNHHRDVWRAEREQARAVRAAHRRAGEQRGVLDQLSQLGVYGAPGQAALAAATTWSGTGSISSKNSAIAASNSVLAALPGQPWLVSSRVLRRGSASGGGPAAAAVARGIWRELARCCQPEYQAMRSPGSRPRRPSPRPEAAAGIGPGVL